MSSDVQNICDALARLHEVWASVIEIAIGIWFLTTEIGLALLGPLVITIVAVFATMAVSSRMGPAQKAWMEATQTRIGVTSRMLESMKGVKMLGLTPYTSSLIHRLRKHEIALSLNFRRLMATCITLANVSNTIGPGAAFVIFVIINRHSSQTLDVGQAFTALSLIELVSRPVSTLIFSVSPLMGSLGCIDRIQTFLLSNGRNDHRIIINSTKGELDEDDKEQSASVAESDVPLRTIVSKAKPSSRNPAPIRLLHATFAWSASGPPVVKDISFEVHRGNLTMIVGPVGCGKSSLLRGLLGEIPSSKGFVYAESPQSAFVAQSPWIQHKTFRNNVLGDIDDGPGMVRNSYSCLRTGK